jgi:hypothetical protein
MLFLPLALGAVSRACNDSQQLLAENTALVEATPDARLCQVELKPGKSGSCTVDFRKESATFESLCLQAGAQFREVNFAYDCKVSDPNSFSTYDVDFYIKKRRICSGPISGPSTAILSLREVQTCYIRKAAMKNVLKCHR